MNQRRHLKRRVSQSQRKRRVTKHQALIQVHCPAEVRTTEQTRLSNTAAPIHKIDSRLDQTRSRRSKKATHFTKTIASPYKTLSDGTTNHMPVALDCHNMRGV